MLSNDVITLQASGRFYDLYNSRTVMGTAQGPVKSVISPSSGRFYYYTVERGRGEGWVVQFDDSMMLQCMHFAKDHANAVH